MTGQLPSGTVTLVLGDVESSTERWEASSDTMAAAMHVLNTTIDELVLAHTGVRPVEQGEGDSFVAAFARAADALSFAIAVQDQGGLPVRIGVHTGDIDVVDGGYAGAAIIRAARIRDAGHGGQVLLSQATAALLADDVALEDLGEHGLKGLSRPERIWQLPGDFPPLRLTDTGSAVVPGRFTRFIGRDVEIDQVRDLTKDRGCVTLTGAGGVGKTRLALELVAERAKTPATPSWFVDLAAVDDEGGVALAVADAVRAQSSPGRPPVDNIVAIVRDRDALIVFDNCEHLLGAASSLATDLLGRCANLTVLATSREPLGLTGEVTYRLPSMTDGEAAALFVECAQRADPRFTVDDVNAPVIAEICGRLDGMPLAIELAAARIRVFSTQQLLDALHDRFRLLTGGARTALPRQRTLEASVEWSHALLLDAERTLLRRLSVFAGGFSLDGAAAVAADGDLEPHHVFDLLVQLVEKSLVISDVEPGRFRMLETIRHYAAARLVDAGETDGCRRRHYEFILRVVGERDIGSVHELAHLQAIRVEESNLRRAVQWAEDQPDDELLLAIALPASKFWRYARRAKEAAATMHVVEHRTRDAPPAVRARVLTELAAAIRATGNYAEAAPFAHEALSLSEEAGDDVVRMSTLLDVHVVLANDEIHDPSLLDEAVEIARRIGDEKSLALGTALRGFFAMREEGSREAAAPLLRDGIALARKHGMHRLEGAALAWLCMGEFVTGTVQLEEWDRATALLEATNQGMVLANIYAIRALARLVVGDEAGCERDLAALDELALELDDLSGQLCEMLGHGLVSLVSGNIADAIRYLKPLGSSPAAEGAGKAFLALLAIAEALNGELDDAEAHAVTASDYPFDAMGLLRASVAVARAEVAYRHGDRAAAWEISVKAATASDVARSFITPLLVGVVGRSAFHLGRAEEAVRVLSASTEGNDTAAPSAGVWRASFEESLAQCRAQLGDEAFEALWTEGASLSLDDALALVQRGRGPRQRPMLGWGSLTPTERDVAGLVAQGMPNRDVAERLFISESTVKTHLTRIYSKVGVSNRAQLAASARTDP